MLSGGIFAVAPEAQYRLQDHNGPGAEFRVQKFSVPPKVSPFGALRFFHDRFFCPVWPNKDPDSPLDWFLESTSHPPQPLTIQTPPAPARAVVVVADEEGVPVSAASKECRKQAIRKRPSISTRSVFTDPCLQEDST